MATVVAAPLQTLDMPGRRGHRPAGVQPETFGRIDDRGTAPNFDVGDDDACALAVFPAGQNCTVGSDDQGAALESAFVSDWQPGHAAPQRASMRRMQYRRSDVA